MHLRLWYRASRCYGLHKRLGSCPLKLTFGNISWASSKYSTLIFLEAPASRLLSIERGERRIYHLFTFSDLSRKSVICGTFHKEYISLISLGRCFLHFIYHSCQKLNSLPLMSSVKLVAENGHSQLLKNVTSLPCSGQSGGLKGWLSNDTALPLGNWGSANLLPNRTAGILSQGHDSLP